MRIECNSPLWLLVLMPCAVLVIWLLRITGLHSLRWRAVCVLLPGIAAALLAMALADPTFVYQPRASELMVLLDLSGSTRTSPWQRPGWLQAMAHAHLPAGTTLHIVGFTDHAQQLCTVTNAPNDSTWPLEWPRVDGQSTSISAALAWHSDTPDRAMPRWLITDGCAESPAGNAGELPFQLAMTVIPPPRVDVGIANLQIQPLPSADPATPPSLELWATIQSTGAARGSVEFRRDGHAFAQRSIAFSQAGAQLLRMQDAVVLDHQVLYEVRISFGDPWPEDDVASIFAPPAGPPRVIVVKMGAGARAVGPAAEPLGSASVASPNTLVIAPRDLANTLSELANAQLMVLDNIPMEALRPGSDLLLQHYVEGTGGGLLLTGDSAAFGPGHYPQGVLETLSPLASVPPKTVKHIVYLLDGSGSMNEPAQRDRPGNKFAFALSAVQRSLDLLRPQDEISIITFNSTANLAAHGPVKDLDPALFARLRQVVPTGATNPDSVLTILPRVLVPDSLVIILTDGEIPAMDQPHWRTLLTDAKASLAIVAPKSNGGALFDLAASSHAAWMATDDPTQWPALLTQAVEDNYVGHAMHTAIAWKALGDGPLSGHTNRWIETFAKPEAQLRAASQDGEHPLAATARRGLGQVGAIAFSDASEDFTALSALLRLDLLAPPGDRRFAVRAERQADSWLITADGIDKHNFIDGEDLTLHAFLADGTTKTLPLPQTAPGRYQAALGAPAGAFNAIITRAENSPNQPAQPSLIARINPPALPSDEWPATTTAKFVAPSGIALIRPEDSVPWISGFKARILPLRHILVLAAAAFVLCALWLRRGGRRSA